MKADLFGRNLGDNVWGSTDVERSFTIGEYIEAVVGNKDKKMHVYNDRGRAREFPVSLGRDNQFDTRNGTYVLGDAPESPVMDSRTYGLSIGEGGCVNATPEDARWFQNYVHRGDPVVTKNTGGQTLTPYDGLGYWNLDLEPAREARKSRCTNRREHVIKRPAVPPSRRSR